MIKQFNMENIMILQKMGYRVHVATNFEYGSTMSLEENQKLKKELKSLGVVSHQIDFPRGMWSIKSLKHILNQVTSVVKNDDFYFIHAHSTIGGICSRLIGHKFHIKTVYTAHGFQFFKGSPLKSWLTVYPIEKFLSRYTDVLLTINQEDFRLAKSKLHAKKVYYVPGIGVDVNKISKVKTDKYSTRKALEIPEHAIFLLSVGELSNRKNQEVVLKALGTLQDSSNIYYGICGIGANQQKLLSIAETLGLKKNLRLFGYRTDIIEIMKAADVFVFPSLLEGLPVSLMEAMAAGLPVAASNIRGNTDLITNDVNGYLFDPNDISNVLSDIFNLVQDSRKTEAFKIKSKKTIKRFDKKIINQQMLDIYQSL
ncbi:glycosyltransferase [Lapidilactobacillus gannanensis]|uniref:Glycosyltransferase n=2 Tax=Lapidilactobacillus gannanensis TaxID=2486002 RepID=A0ABW4BMP5_9LACO